VILERLRRHRPDRLRVVFTGSDDRLLFHRWRSAGAKDDEEKRSEAAPHLHTFAKTEITHKYSSRRQTIPSA
jgi:hypothetical protein